MAMSEHLYECKKRIQELEQQVQDLDSRVQQWQKDYDELNDDFTTLAYAIIEAQINHEQTN